MSGKRTVTCNTTLMLMGFGDGPHGAKQVNGGRESCGENQECSEGWRARGWEREGSDQWIEA